MKKEKIKYGDTVRIVNPYFFVRCGYNDTLEKQSEEILKNHEYDLMSVLKKITPLIDRDSKQFNVILKELAYLKCQQNKFGGSERKIFTELKEEFKNELFSVINKKIHKTGNYVSGRYYGSYGDEMDYEPAYLEKEKTHVILEVAPINSSLKCYGFYFIEQANVVKV